MAILRFDTEANLQAWMNSPERQALLRESQPFIDEFHARVVRSGFDQWFTDSGKAPSGPPVWKQNMVVLLMLYPVVFLFGKYVQAPFLMGWAHIPFPAALFIGNMASVVLLNWLVPWASRALAPWLNPPRQNLLRANLTGTTLLVVLYGVLVTLFCLIS